MTAQKNYIDCYSFGLQTSSSWTRENSNNDFLYNEGSELNKTTGWYETAFRNYDAALGRLTSVDPMATKFASYSAYHYAGNNPVIFNDPTGADFTVTVPHPTKPGYWQVITQKVDVPASYAGNEAADRYKKFVEESPALRHYAEMLQKQEQDAATLQWIQNIFNSVPAGQNATITPNADGSGYYYESMTSYVDTDGQVTVESRMNFVARQGGPRITGAVINTGALSGNNNCANCGYLNNGLGTNVRPDLGYFNGVEIQFNISGNLKGYKVSIARTKTFIDARNGAVFDSGTNRDDGPASGNVQLVNGKIYSIDMPGFAYGSITAGTLSRDMIGHFTETAIIQDSNGNIVSQFSVKWQSSIQISRSSPDGAFIFTGSIGPR